MNGKIRKRCGECRYWASYGSCDEDGGAWGECVLAEHEDEGAACLHVLGVRAGPTAQGPFAGPLRRKQEVAPGCFVAAVLMTDRDFGCVSFDPIPGDPHIRG